jgi:hypothetical protein
MREIKFRGKRVDTGQWVYGFYFIGKNTYGKTKSQILVEEKFIKNSSCKGSVWGIEDYKVIPETVGQYITKNDKNVEFWEGDIDSDGDVIKWDEVFGVFKLGGVWLCNLNLNNIKIVGNIHDQDEKQKT